MNRMVRGVRHYMHIAQGHPPGTAFKFRLDVHVAVLRTITPHTVLVWAFLLGYIPIRRLDVSSPRGLLLKMGVSCVFKFQQTQPT